MSLLATCHKAAQAPVAKVEQKGHHPRQLAGQDRCLQVRRHCRPGCSSSRAAEAPPQAVAGAAHPLQEAVEAGHPLAVEVAPTAHAQGNQPTTRASHSPESWMPRRHAVASWHLQASMHVVLKFNR